MTTVSRPKRRGNMWNQRLKMNGSCFIVTMSILVICSLLSTLWVEPPPNDDYRVATRDRDTTATVNERRNAIPTNDKQKLHLQETRKDKNVDESNSSPKLEDWTTSAQDGLEDLDFYGTKALTGSFIFKDGPACATALETSPCLIHFPRIELKNVIDHDECLDIHVFLPGARPLADPTTPYAPPKHTQHLQPPPSFSDKHALLTRCGCKARASGVTSNQDRAVLVSPFLVHDGASRNDFVMGLFDGHGLPGHVVSHFSALELPGTLLRWLELHYNHKDHQSGRDAAVRLALNETFLEIDRTSPEVPSGGSTASVMLRISRTIYVANAGDSQSFIALCNTDSGSVNIVYKNGLHKPHLAEERQRIEQMGGHVQMPQGPGDSSRVMVPIEGGAIGEFMALAMSRSIGDREAKPAGVIAEPTVDVVSLDKLLQKPNNNWKLFAVTASDGLFDRVPISIIAKHLAVSLYRQDSLPPLQACEQLVMKASEMWVAGGMPYRDDITIAVTKVEQ